jgi:hypothetical protein
MKAGTSSLKRVSVEFLELVTTETSANWKFSFLHNKASQTAGAHIKVGREPLMRVLSRKKC